VTVRLRRVATADLAWLAAMSASRELSGAHNWGGPVDPHELERTWRVQLDDDGFVTRDRGRLVVEVADGEPIGDVAWRTERWGPSELSACPAIGIALLPDHRGHGHGTQSQRLLVEYLFRVHDAHRVQSDTATDNVAEQRALERAGFVREGVVRDAEHRDGRYHDHVLYGWLRRDWTPDDALAALIPAR
jgi:RimJ/RimL family protein N-acetyltransferase